MDNIPYEVRELLSGLKYFKAGVATGWGGYSRFAEQAEYEARQKAVRAVANAAAEAIRDKKLLQVRQEPEGNVYSVEAYVLTYEELCRLATDAYNKGFLRAPKIRNGAWG